MKLYNVGKVISVICSLVAFLGALVGLKAGLESFNAAGMGKIGAVFIMPSICALLVIAADFLIAIDKVKGGLSYSQISSLVKIGIILVVAFFDPVNMVLITVPAIALLPSILNVIKLTAANKSQ